MGTTRDQTTMLAFRALLIGQLLVTLPAGALALIASGTLAQVLGYPGSGTFVYGIYGAAVLGYAVAAVVGYVQPGWREGRIAAVATLTFAAAAVVAAVIQLAQGERSLLAFGVPLAAALAIPSCIYFLRRDEGDRSPTGRAIQPWFHWFIGLASITAAGPGIGALLIPDTLRDLVGGSFDPMIARLAGASTLGYATAGILQFQAARWGEIRLQNLAAITFNGLSVVAAGAAIAAGNSTILVPVILVAATVFTAGLAYGQWEANRRVS